MDDGARSATDAPRTSAGAGQGGPRPASRAALAVAPDTVRKPVNALAIVPQARKITPLFRKSYNVMLHLAQEQGMEHDVFRAPVSAVLAGLDFDSNDTGLVKRHLRAMATTAVEWQSPTTGEGASWAVSGLIGHAEIKRERGQNWLEWSYSVRLKQELLEPAVFARLSLEILSQLRSHGAIALYEICSRYRDVGRTSRQAWSWWRPVLSGKPETDKQKLLEYRFFKRDVLKTAMAELNTITDIEVELLEYKQGRFVADLQFTIRKKQQAQLPLKQPLAPVDMSQVVRAVRLGIDEERAEALLIEHGSPLLARGLDTLERRQASAYPEPLRDGYRYLKTVLTAGGGLTEPAAPGLAGPAVAPDIDARRRARWSEEWLRRRREAIVAQIDALGEQAQQELVEALQADMAQRNVHPSIRKRLLTSGWQHTMVVHEMVRFFARASIGETWDQPTAEQLLAIAARLGDGGAAAEP